MKENFFLNNSYYEGLVQNLYGGSKGCFSLFMHFFYQYNQSCVFDKEYSCCFLTLYELELKNCEILARVLLKMGGDNKYYSNNRKFLSGYSVDYVKDFVQIYLLDVELLEISMIETKNVVDKIENKEIAEMVRDVLKNKKIALEILKEKYLKIVKTIKK